MQDTIIILYWWFILLLIGLFNLPVTFLVFSKLNDFGYAFAKVMGIVCLSYLVFIFSILHILPFNNLTIVISIFILLAVNIFALRKIKLTSILKDNYGLFSFQEIIFLIALFFWSFIRSHEPSIHGLEKFMDLGFVNTIGRTTYLPPTDMWFPPYPINYYYFGHFVTTLLTKISTIPSYITYNLMIATLFAFSFSLACSIVYNLLQHIKVSVLKSIVGGIVGGFLLALGGNLHTIYTLFSPYQNESPVPFWQLQFQPTMFPNGYWYPNATRYIPYTIHEFPIYSFVVSDLHGHVLDIPFVLLSLVIIYVLWISKRPPLLLFVFQGMLLAIMYMTNAWDGILYFGLTLLVLFAKFIISYSLQKKEIYIHQYVLKKFSNFSIQKALRIGYTIYPYALRMIILIVALTLFLKPFNMHFKPFVSGIGLLCAPSAISKGFIIGLIDVPGVAGIKVGNMELIDEGHCEPSPIWQLIVLYGFFYFFIISYLIFLLLDKKRVTKTDFYVLLLIIFSTILIIAPELFYAKDIYPRHFRANTMFKLTYQAFMMLSLVSAFVILRLFSHYRKNKTPLLHPFTLFVPISLILVTAVLTYPYFAITSYYANLTAYKGLDGLSYLKQLYPSDYDAIMWINRNIKSQPVMLEAQGDSYTDYERISTNTGLPTVLGWTVHEWLWRGSYDIPSPRIAEVASLYESADITLTNELIKKYNIEYIYIGQLERDKYPKLNEDKIKELGKVVYQRNNTRIYKVNRK